MAHVTSTASHARVSTRANGLQVTVREVLAVRDVLLAAGPDDFLQPVNFREQMDAQMTGTMDEDGGCGSTLLLLLVLCCCSGRCHACARSREVESAKDGPTTPSVFLCLLFVWSGESAPLLCTMSVQWDGA
eukprot:1160252-Pelagomonas_calceolata.AAC.11